MSTKSPAADQDRVNPTDDTPEYPLSAPIKPDDPMTRSAAASNPKLKPMAVSKNRQVPFRLCNHSPFPRAVASYSSPMMIVLGMRRQTRKNAHFRRAHRSHR
ncbi:MULTISPECIES: hypothetical protein [unclassified Pseudomonas]|uniref:hypothetical protein n=1 Tax=unclassified Pseudomonas TaxID=196821 RepID=UPI0025EA97AF|nr:MULTISPECIES: hypothetical protein [unclassified Pseudomonas]